VRRMQRVQQNRDAEVAPIPPVAGLTQGQQQQADRRGKKDK